MTNSTPRPGSPLLLARRGLFGVAASSAVILLAACSSPATPTNTPTATASSAPAATPSTAAATASGTATAAATAKSAVKELVDGFPKTVVPLMTGAQIQASSVQLTTPVSVAALTATVTAPAADVLSYYSKVFTDQGFTAQPGDAVDGVPLKTFIRAGGQEIITVSVVQTAATATFTVGATLLPASLK
ncbi:hypothetical protein [Arthrobacter glacialis]|uniref:Uncharacterized protein n=1 Tax=Arthrobacter glacialis TaxID=1664 RepID=A0A2S3ZUA9_ARTGL|nr:hypothetical protein [Arthrobacter glacialis]POH72851.1 hypothetical protein CVS27_13330 [Arthrobacter glacialis]